MLQTVLGNALRRFARADRGNVIITFALATIPMIGFVGAAVDYSRGNSAKAAMQAAVDSTALMLSKEAPNLTSGQLSTKADQYFRALLNRPEISDIVVTPSFTNPAGSTLQLNLTATGRVATTFTKVVGQQQMDIGVSSQVVWGMKKLELALALDNTGSMASSNKMVELKKAAKALLNTLKSVAKKDDDVRVAIIPFAQEVNVGNGNVSAPWIDWEDWESRNGTCSKGKATSKKSCTSGVWTPSNRNTWNGCVMDRAQDHDVRDTTPSPTIVNTLFPAIQATACPVPMQPLVSIIGNWGRLISTVDSMSPTGKTNVTIGMVWAWHALTPNLPLTEATAPNDETEKVIILLTDGDNTENRWTTNSAQIDDRTRLVCNNVKAAGIKVYTIRVIDGNASLLQACATRPDMYYNVQNAGQLNSVFTAIAKNLAKLHIAR